MNTETVTVAGQTFTMPCPFEEGHALTAGEASQLNQVYHENLRNNVAKKVKDAVAAGNFDQAEWQAKIDELAASYEFGKRRAGGPRASTDPVKREATRLAKEAIIAKIKANGKKPSDYSNIGDLAAQLVANNPSFTERAKEILAAQQEEADASLGDLMSSLEAKPAEATA